jgi:hypothetical protein
MNRRTALRTMGIGAAAMAAMPLLDLACLPALPAPPVGVDALRTRARDLVSNGQTYRVVATRTQDNTRGKGMPCPGDGCPPCPGHDGYVHGTALHHLRIGDVVTITETGVSSALQPAWPHA